MSTRELERRRLADQAAQARRDLEELDRQEAAGEIDPVTARRLRATYLEELQEAEAALAGIEEDRGDVQPQRSRARMAVGAGVVVVAFAVIVTMVGSFVQERDDGPLQGVAAGQDFDPSAYSNETMEAVITANADDPAVAGQLPYMRFALAERYFEEGDHQRAFGHYQAILEGEPPPDLASAALTRVGWIVWVGNGETELALGLLDRAVEAAPDSSEARYVKARILWCGADRPEEAAPLFREVLGMDALDPEVRAQVEDDLARAEAGAPCSG